MPRAGSHVALRRELCGWLSPTWRSLSSHSLVLSPRFPAGVVALPLCKAACGSRLESKQGALAGGSRVAALLSLPDLHPLGSGSLASGRRGGPRAERSEAADGRARRVGGEQTNGDLFPSRMHPVVSPLPSCVDLPPAPGSHPLRPPLARIRHWR
jgi:hypothetical protein